MDVTKKLAMLLEDRGWSEYRLAKESNLPHSTVLNIFQRNNLPSISTLEAMCNGLGITLAQFFTEDESLVMLTEEQKEILEKYLKGVSPRYYPPVENLLDLIYEHYTENNSIAPQTTEAGKEAKQKEKDLETWLRGIARMDVLVDDYGGDIPLWEKIMDRQGSVCCAWEKTAFEEGMKVGIRLMLEALDI